MADMNFSPSGLILLDKDEGLTSQGAVNRVKRLLGAKKAGHTGTLDPLATGTLPILLGRAVKASEFMLTSDKHYGATLLLGVTTDTEDITGTVIERSDRVPTENEVRAAAAKLVGETMQTPPMYSALKVGGKKLYDLARSGITVERQPRQITVHSIGVEKISDTEYQLDVRCSKGTYIRTLCADIGAALGVGGVMKALRRLEASGYGIDRTVTLSALEKMTEDERHALIIPTEDIFRAFPKVILPDFFAHLARCGQQIYQKKIGTDYSLGNLVRLCDTNGFFAVGEVREFEDGSAIKPIRQF